MKVRHTVLAAALAVVTLSAFYLPSSEGAAPVAVPTSVVDSEPTPHPTFLAPKPRVVKPSRQASRSPLWAVEFGRCVIRHESINAGLYKAENPTSSASGAYQFTDGTWHTQSRLAGHPGYSRAKYAPPRVQDAVFYYTVLHGGTRHWKGTNCGYGT